MSEADHQNEKNWNKLWDDWLTGKISILPWLLKSFQAPDALAGHLTWFFTFALALFACWAWLDGKETASKLQVQADAALDANRPWLEPTENASISLCFSRHKDKNDSGFLLEIVGNTNVRNAGRDPGVDTVVSTNATTEKSFEGTLGCQESPDTIPGLAVFPGRERPIPYHTRFPVANFIKTDKVDDLSGIYLSSCIYYRTGPKEKLRYTNFRIDFSIKNVADYVRRSTKQTSDVCVESRDISAGGIVVLNAD